MAHLTQINTGNATGYIAQTINFDTTPETKNLAVKVTQLFWNEIGKEENSKLASKILFSDATKLVIKKKIYTSVENGPVSTKTISCEEIFGVKSGFSFFVDSSIKGSSLSVLEDDIKRMIKSITQHCEQNGITYISNFTISVNNSDDHPRESSKELYSQFLCQFLTFK